MPAQQRDVRHSERRLLPLAEPIRSDPAQPGRRTGELLEGLSDADLACVRA